MQESRSEPDAVCSVRFRTFAEIVHPTMDPTLLVVNVTTGSSCKS